MGIYAAIDNRAWKMLNIVANEFQSFTPISSVSANRIVFDGSKLGVERLTASYNLINKWMGRVYIYTWTWSLPDDKPVQDMTIRLTYAGKLNGNRKEIRFVSKQATPLLDRLNSDKLIDELCNEVDYERVELRYSIAEKMWHVQMRPNYGDFIWILLPPVKYARRPKTSETTSTMNLMKQLVHFIKDREEE